MNNIYEIIIAIISNSNSKEMKMFLIVKSMLAHLLTKDCLKKSISVFKLCGLSIKYRFYSILNGI